MAIETSQLDEMQSTYKAAVEDWIATIRHEELLAYGNHSETQIDQWEKAGRDEEDARDKAKEAKKAYESALREEFFNF